MLSPSIEVFPIILQDISEELNQSAAAYDTQHKISYLWSVNFYSISLKLNVYQRNY